MSTLRDTPNAPKTYAHMREYPDGQRWELLDGSPSLQAAPSWQHQHLVRELMIALAGYLKGNRCQVFPAPFDVLLAAGKESDDDVKTVLQPDLVVVCDPSGLRKTGFRGTPKLVVEITSPGTARMDLLVKFRIYQQAGIPAYWIVQPEERNLLQYHLNAQGAYDLVNVLTEADVLTDMEFPEWELPVKGLFPPLPDEVDHIK